MIDMCTAFADPSKFPDTSTLLKMQEFLQNEKNVKEIYSVWYWEMIIIIESTREIVDDVLSW